MYVTSKTTGMLQSLTIWGAGRKAAALPLVGVNFWSTKIWGGAADSPLPPPFRHAWTIDKQIRLFFAILLVLHIIGHTYFYFYFYTYSLYDRVAEWSKAPLW